MKRFRIEAILASLIAAGMILVGGGAFYFVATMSVHAGPDSLPSHAEGQVPANELAAVTMARALLKDAVVRENLPSVSLAVARNGEAIWTEAIGYADVDRRVEATPDTLYRLGSVSKTLTAAGALLLHDRGRLDLDAPVQQYVPAYPAKQWPVTTRHLLGDAAGVHVFLDGPERIPPRSCANLDEAVALFADKPLRFKPGSEYRFSTYGWVLVSAIVEKVAGRPFADFMRTEVFEPLGLTHTRLDAVQAVPGRAWLYFPRADTRPALGLEDANPADYSCWSGAGAYLSTPAELARFGSAMLTPGYLKADTLSMLQAPLTLEDGSPTGFSLGWTVDTIPMNGRSVRMLRHRGNTTGGTAVIMLFPDLHLAMVAVTNVSHADALAPLALQLAEVFAGD
jgi:CubicO group peptidase (beta-lactamase class C family)